MQPSPAAEPEPAAEPVPAPHPDGDPALDRTLLLRLIAGVKGL
jgi:hypothetical protein